MSTDDEHDQINETQVALRIAARRREIMVSKAQMANALGIAAGNYAYLERRCSAAAQKRHIQAIASLLDTTVEWLQTGEGEVAPDGAVQAAEIALDGVETLSPVIRASLAARAKKKRLALGLSTSQCAGYLGIPVSDMHRMESCLNKSPNIEHEKRWEELLKVPPGWLRDSTLLTASPSSAFVARVAERGGYIKKPHFPLERRNELAQRAKNRRLEIGLSMAAIAAAAGISRAVFAQQEKRLLKFPEPEVEAK